MLKEVALTPPVEWKIGLAETWLGQGLFGHPLDDFILREEKRVRDSWSAETLMPNLDIHPSFYYRMKGRVGRFAPAVNTRALGLGNQESFFVLSHSISIYGLRGAERIARRFPEARVSWKELDQIVQDSTDGLLFKLMSKTYSQLTAEANTESSTLMQGLVADKLGFPHLWMDEPARKLLDYLKSPQRTRRGIPSYAEIAQVTHGADESVNRVFLALHGVFPTREVFFTDVPDIENVPASVEYCPETKAMHRETLDMLPGALTLLSRRQAVAFALTSVEGWSLRFVSELMRIPVTEVKKLAEAGLASIRDLYTSKGESI